MVEPVRWDIQADGESQVRQRRYYVVRTHLLAPERSLALLLAETLECGVSFDSGDQSRKNLERWCSGIPAKRRAASPGTSVLMDESAGTGRAMETGTGGTVRIFYGHVSAHKSCGALYAPSQCYP